MMRAIPAVLAATLLTLCASAGFAQRVPDLRGFDMQKLLQMKARAEAAQAGQGSMSAGDLTNALKLAKQLGLSTDDLAAKIHAQAGNNPALKGMSKKQLAEHVRALSRKHGQALNDSPKRPGARRSPQKPAYTREDLLRQYQMELKKRRNSRTNKSRTSTTTPSNMRRKAASTAAKRTRSGAPANSRARNGISTTQPNAKPTARKKPSR